MIKKNSELDTNDKWVIELIKEFCQKQLKPNLHGSSFTWNVEKWLFGHPKDHSIFEVVKNSA